MTFDSHDALIVPFTRPYPHQVTTRNAKEEFVVRPTTPLRGRREGYYVLIGNDRLVSNKTIDLLGCVQGKGHSGHAISIDAPNQHTTWASVEQAHAWCVADREGYVMQWPRTLFWHDLDVPLLFNIALHLKIIKALGGTPATYWHRPGNESEHYGRTDFKRNYVICFPNMSDAFLAGLILGPTFSDKGYRSLRHKLCGSRSAIDSTVKDAITEYRREMSLANLDNAKTEFWRAYSDEVQHQIECMECYRQPDRMGFR